MNIFLIAFLKFDDRGPEFGFKRIHLYTFHHDLKEAKEYAVGCFCDEAGWYEGALVEERKEGDPFFRGQRVWFKMNPEGKLVEIPAPKYYDDVINLI